MRSKVFALLLLMSAGIPVPAAEDPLEVLRRVTAEARTIPKQAEALARLAWPEEGRSDPAVAAAARDRLVKFGHNGLTALRDTLGRVEPVWTADVTAALIAARWRVPSGDPPDYLPGLVDALWFGSAEAQRLAMIEFARFPFTSAAAPIIDAVQAHPELTPVAIATFEKTHEVRGRFFLQSVVLAGPDRHRGAAAAALAALGAPGLDLLREAVHSDDPLVRRVAMEALLPAARPDDLTVLYEYLDRYGDTEAALAGEIRARAAEIEAAVESGTGAAEDDSGS